MGREQNSFLPVISIKADGRGFITGSLEMAVGIVEPANIVHVSTIHESWGKRVTELKTCHGVARTVHVHIKCRTHCAAGYFCCTVPSASVESVGIDSGGILLGTLAEHNHSFAVFLC